jgi:DNA-binding GntR family transcriptional regulator
MTTQVSAAERAHHEIRAAIASGEIAGGTMVSENDLAARLGVSRTPIRAAILRLQDEGWITVFPKRGALVREIGADESMNIADARYALELSAVRRVSPAARADLVRDLETIILEQENRLTDGSVDGFVELDIQFHRRLVESGGNPILLDFYDRLRQRQALMISRGLAATNERAKSILTEHRVLLTCIEREAWDEFDAALRNHLLATHGALFRGL